MKKLVLFITAILFAATAWSQNQHLIGLHEKDTFPQEKLISENNLILDKKYPFRDLSDSNLKPDRLLKNDSQEKKILVDSIIEFDKDDQIIRRSIFQHDEKKSYKERTFFYSRKRPMDSYFRNNFNLR